MQHELSPEELSWIKDQVRKGPQPSELVTRVLFGLVILLMFATIATLSAPYMAPSRELTPDSIKIFAFAVGICAIFIAISFLMAHLSEGAASTDASHSVTTLRGTFNTVGRGTGSQILFNEIPCVIPPGWKQILPYHEVTILAAETRREDRFLVVVQIEGLRSLQQDWGRGMRSIRPGRAKNLALWGALLVASVLPIAASGPRYGWIAWPHLLFHSQQRLLVTQLGDLDLLSPEPAREVQLPSLILKHEAPRPPESQSNLVGFTQAPTQTLRDSLDSLMTEFEQLEVLQKQVDALLPGIQGTGIAWDWKDETFLDAIQRLQGKNPTVWVSKPPEELHFLVFRSFGGPHAYLDFLSKDRGAPVAIVIGKSSKGWMFESGSRFPAIVKTLRVWLGLVALLAPLLFGWALVQWRKERSYLKPLEAMAD
jgi:hypothetical protein